MLSWIFNTRQFSLRRIPSMRALLVHVFIHSTHNQQRAYVSIAGKSGNHSACYIHLYLFTQLFFPLFKQKTLAQKSEMEIKLGGFLKTAVQYPMSWALSRDVGSRDFQSLPLCYVKGTSTKRIVLGAWGCGRDY